VIGWGWFHLSTVLDDFRLKLVRRQMYGRGGIDLLQAGLVGTA
jgi:hypothetical protein